MTITQLIAKGAELELESLQKSFAGKSAVRDVSFTLRPGEFLTMLGPSGSGKTTTLNMIAGFLLPDSGVVTLSGRDITETPAHRRDIGMVFQNYALFPHLNAVKNVMFPLEMRGVGRRDAKRRAMRALEMVELQQCADQPPRQLSGGQQQRVALARAFVFEPGLLLMDEPLGALDKRLRESMQLEIMRICREVGSTVVYVTHDQEEALTMSDRIAVYNKGRIEQLDTAEGLYERPRTKFVADFIGDSSILRCVLEPDGAVTGEGWRLDDAHAEQLRAGPASLVLRPEMVSIAERATDATSVGATQAIVSDIVYLGSHIKYILATPAGESIQSKMPMLDSRDRFKRGDVVTATWRPDHGVMLPENEGVMTDGQERSAPV